MVSLRKAAKGSPCTLRLPGCAPGPENEAVVLCHRGGAGMALKADDLDAVLGCAHCHTILDGWMLTGGPYDRHFDRAKALTHGIWKRNGLLD